MKVLIVGGSGVAGQCAIRAIKKHDPVAQIWATSSKDFEVAGATETIRHIDLNQPQAIQQLKNFGEKLDFLF